MVRSAELEAAYRRADYCVALGGGELVLRIGVHETAADARLRAEAGVRASWAIVTPCNPRSDIGAGNAAALERFALELQARGWPQLRSVNRDPAGDWPDEPGALLIDIALPAAIGLGRLFDQNAIVAGELGRAPRLVWL